MNGWPVFSLILLAGPSVAPGMETATPGRHVALGNDALGEGLWEIAALHFRQSLADPRLDAGERPRIAIRLAESEIRGGNPGAAAELLDRSFPAKTPEALFWKAQALAAQDRPAEAVEIFGTLLADPAAPHRTEAALTRASLQLALGEPQAALETLDRAAPGDTRIGLHRVEILLDHGRTADARAAMPESASTAAADLPLVNFLAARLLLAEGDHAAAQAAFQELLNRPDGQSLVRYHAAAVGLSDAVAAQGDPQLAALKLLEFLRKRRNPVTPALEMEFGRIVAWLPEKPAATDPVLAALDEWIPKVTLPSLLPLDVSQPGAVAAWPVLAADPGEAAAYALYARAIGLHRVGTPEAVAGAESLLRRLPLDFPRHRLANRALYQTACGRLRDGDTAGADSLLDTLRDVAGSPGTIGAAAQLEGLAAYRGGNWERAAKLFDEAARQLAGTAAGTAKLQSVIARLRGGDLKGVQLVQNTADPRLAADIELERALATTPPAAEMTALREFLGRFPDHPRATEARLAAVEAALALPEPQLDFARGEMGRLATEDPALAPRVALARLRLADLTADPAAAEIARSVIGRYPGTPAAEEAALVLGRGEFQAGNYNAARMIFETLAKSDAGSARAQAAWLLAGRSAALGGTPTSKEESLSLFDNAISAKGPLSDIAALEKASQLIDMARLREASDFLGKWLARLPADDALQVPAGLLLGGALYAQGSSDPASLAAALAVYDKLLARAKERPALFNRLQLLRGMTLEQLADPDHPPRKREAEAFEAYNSVLEISGPPAEWEYFERCGFRALALLEKAERWQAFIGIARKIASFNGPRAAEAAARASQIQLDQMIW